MNPVYMVVSIIVTVLLAAGASMHAQDIPLYSIGRVHWTKENVDRVCIPNAGNVIVIGRNADTSIVVLDPRTGSELRRFGGSHSFQNTPGYRTLDCSPDGLFCMMTEYKPVRDTTARTKLYRISDGQLLWERRESGYVLGLSGKLQRALVQVRTDDTSTQAQHERYELRDLATGATIVELDGSVGNVFMDEQYRRIYFDTQYWGENVGEQIIELDPETGMVLRSWQKLSGTMCRPATSNELLIGSAGQIVALDVETGSRRKMLACPEGETEGCECMSPQGLPVWTMDPENGRIAYVHFPSVQNMETDPNPYYTVRQFYGQSGSWCFIHGRLDAGSSRQYLINYTNRHFYLISPERSLVCRGLQERMDVKNDEKNDPWSFDVDGGRIRIDVHGETGSEAIVSLVDMRGVVLDRSVCPVGSQPIVVPIDGLPTAAYLCNVVVGSRTMSRTFVMVR